MHGPFTYFCSVNESMLVLGMSSTCSMFSHQGPNRQTNQFMILWQIHSRKLTMEPKNHSNWQGKSSCKPAIFGGPAVKFSRVYHGHGWKTRSGTHLWFSRLYSSRITATWGSVLARVCCAWEWRRARHHARGYRRWREKPMQRRPCQPGWYALVGVDGWLGGEMNKNTKSATVEKDMGMFC